MYKIVTKHFRSNVRNEILGVKSKSEAVQMAHEMLTVYGVYDFEQVSETQWAAAIDMFPVVSIEVVESDEVLKPQP